MLATELCPVFHCPFLSLVIKEYYSQRSSPLLRVLGLSQGDPEDTSLTGVNCHSTEKYDNLPKLRIWHYLLALTEQIWGNF